MSIHYRRKAGFILVTGNTFPHKDQIKSLGARFDFVAKLWRLPETSQTLQAVDDLCRQYGGGAMDQGVDQPPKDLEPIWAPSVASADPRQSSTPLKEPITETHAEAVGLGVKELLAQLNQVIIKAYQEPLWVVGEVQNIAERASGCFLDLAEAGGGHQSSTATIRVIIWKRQLTLLRRRYGEQLKTILTDGMKLRALCRVSFYQDRGSISLHLEDLDPAFTKGALALAREQLLKELRTAGLDQYQKRLTLTPFPLKIGLVSAAGSRAESDFKHQLISGAYPGEIVFQAAAMQGEQTPGQVCDAVDCLVDWRCDAIVITRGGGSAADLRWFDGAEIAYKVAKCPVPIIAAIGHHDDLCVAEDICFQRQKTPTAAAEFILDILRQTRQRLDQLSANIARALQTSLDSTAGQLVNLQLHLGEAADRQLYGALQRLQATAHKMDRRMAYATSELTSKIQAAEFHLNQNCEAPTCATNSRSRSSSLWQLERLQTYDY